jgi:predicted membrane protein
MKAIIIITVFTFLVSSLYAQEYKLAKTSGTLEIREVNHVTIEGNDGNEIIFTTIGDDRDADVDKRSKGLRAISSQGVEDNTGIGLSVIDKGTTVEVRQLKRMDGPDVKISVPKGVAVSIEHTSPYGSDIHIRNVEGALDISTVHNSVKLDNVNGPVDVRTVHGEVDAVFAATIKNPIRIESVHGPVDVSLPTTVKANIHAKTSFGEILVDPDFKMEIEKTAGMIRYNDGVNGKINGGGIEIRLTSTHNNVYLRKK